ncbi:MAG: glucose-6-phosphate isomerase [Gammaproteobacteria bacterium]|nr:glucose-6-phosphate isomerase [Gammaproteobacteria bacterium]MCW8987667.1 glucose-6-phosphate isomerase [Gammaproteobacteria bacterium]MCW9031430.1 glucose-6-phosphate isomerase [Gammaproteobacteria bacterium]
MEKLTNLPAWQALLEHKTKNENIHMRDVFAQDNTRFEDFHLCFNDLLLDYSKNRINKETMSLLIDLARQSGLREWTEKMFSGEKINHTENRAVLHTALRNRSDEPVYVNGQDVMPEVRSELKKMREYSEAIRSGRWLGYSGKPIIDIVNIGVGGSDLGPVMVSEALHPYGKTGLHVHFVSNVDPSHICNTLRDLDPERTLFIVSSKSFTTQDTIMNARTARDWLIENSRNEAAVAKHFIAVAANIEAATSFGIEKENIFKMWDWVGGRYSVWSSIGLSVAIYIGMDRFESLLQGAYEMDQHFRQSPLEENLPVVLALLGIWYTNFYDAESHVLLPYDQHLHRFPAYFQQGDMESNGKSVTRDGQLVDYATGPIIWGELGITGQHAFYQNLHQGTHFVPADFIVPIDSLNPVGDHHIVLLANFFAQTRTLMTGKNEKEARAELVAEGYSDEEVEHLYPSRLMPGNKPSNTILFKALTPKTLGSLIAMYEHKIFVQGIIWQINSYDQPAVELGKKVAASIYADLKHHKSTGNYDSSTNSLIKYFLKNSND